MAFVALLGTEMPANRYISSRRAMPGVGPRTAHYGLVWPNEWPNGEIHARHYERARRARDGRDRSCQHGVGGSSSHHDGTGTDAVTARALSGQLSASSPAGSRRADDLMNPHNHRRARVTSASGKAQALGRSPPIARSCNRVASGTSSFVPRLLPSSKQWSRPTRLLLPPAPRPDERLRMNLATIAGVHERRSAPRA